MDGVVVEEKRREYVIIIITLVIYIYFKLYYESIKMLFRYIYTYIYIIKPPHPAKTFCKNALSVQFKARFLF